MARKNLTEKQEKLLELLFQEKYKGNVPKAVIDAGYSPNSCPYTIVDSLSKEILEKTERYLALNAPNSAINLVDLLENPTKRGAATILNAAREILDRAGVVKKQQMEVQVDAPSALLILPEKKEIIED